MRASEQYFIYHAGAFSSFSEPRFYSIIPYIISILTSRSPCAFARVRIPTRVSDRDTLISTLYFQFSSRRPSPRVVPPRTLSLVPLSSLLRYLTVPGSPGIYVYWYIVCSGRRYPLVNTTTFYPVIVFLSCAETTLVGASQPPRSPFVTSF